MPSLVPRPRVSPPTQPGYDAMVSPTSITWGSMGNRRELTHPNGTSPHTWGTNLCTISLTNTLLWTVWHECATRRYGCLDVTMWQCWLSTHPTGKIPTANPPPFSNICPRYAKRLAIELKLHSVVCVNAYDWVQPLNSNSEQTFNKQCRLRRRLWRQRVPPVPPVPSVTLKWRTARTSVYTARAVARSFTGTALGSLWASTWHV